jgi:hypothetical protein
MGRPVPERARNGFFLKLHGRAERRYQESVYPGNVLMIYGEGLYEDPELGWGSFVGGEIESHAVPGYHMNNRQLLREPYVLGVRDHIQAYLSRRAEPMPAHAKAPQAPS